MKKDLNENLQAPDSQNEATEKIPFKPFQFDINADIRYIRDVFILTLARYKCQEKGAGNDFSHGVE